MEVIPIDDFLYDILIAFFSAIVGAIFGVIIPKLLKSSETSCSVNKQLNFSQIHFEQNKYIYNNYTQNTITHGKEKTQGMSSEEILIAYIVGSLLLIYGFLKFEPQISRLILIMTVFLETAFLTTAYLVTKKNYIDLSIKTILVFNIIATICFPILLYLMKNPITGEFVNKGEILSLIEKDGLFSILLNINAYGFLLYQALGVIVLFGFMFFTLISTLHILSMINLTLENRLTKLWRYIYRKTVKTCSSMSSYIGFGLLLLLISFLFVSGVLSSFLSAI
ncbi:hypothetical protein HZF24_10435 [Sedimentibacter hydroxybenzoicus DSM 7310]|uniref:Uncharacterized protein n=1 Tax=Sedimentibacter hydroxybenzoicus DSM 7310 TaxID=1123245 RepID=A0A974BKI0_SEDHY|nr:hypothetical protein [Sedimentibacter hydroxybenzoicus]NYB74551.1 hypothetical protein [Sedimentibacter hydroxybenzoicus DSM 7310]